ncbi:MAG: Gfo/Idh/MocA family oxidoreductase [bacterium]|nr:Gfo/Idh/MocA family oxidoreductase [bacterium]
MAGLHAAVIGLGVGKGHITSYRDSGAEVTAICDVNEKVLNEVGDEYGIENRFTDYRALLDRKDVDVVSICTPDHLHADPAVELMEAGKHVLVEKPLATTLEDIQRIADTARRTKCKVSHGCQIRYGEVFQEIKRQVKAGEFGEIFYAEADYIANHINLFQGGWRGQLGAEYNAAAGGSIHPVDVIQWIIDSPAEEVTAYGNGIATKAHGLDVYDCVVAIIKFENGCVAKTFTTMGSARPGFRNVQIYGTEKTYVTAPGSPGHLVADLETRKWAPVEVKDSEHDSRHALIADLLQAIENGTEPQLNLEQAVRTAGICVAAFQSMRSGKPVKVPKF